MMTMSLFWREQCSSMSTFGLHQFAEYLRRQHCRRIHLHTTVVMVGAPIISPCVSVQRCKAFCMEHLDGRYGVGMRCCHPLRTVARGYVYSSSPGDHLGSLNLIENDSKRSGPPPQTLLSQKHNFRQCHQLILNSSDIIVLSPDHHHCPSCFDLLPNP